MVADGLTVNISGFGDCFGSFQRAEYPAISGNGAWRGAIGCQWKGRNRE